MYQLPTGRFIDERQTSISGEHFMYKNILKRNFYHLHRATAQKIAL
jgi:hypothetical protein